MSIARFWGASEEYCYEDSGCCLEDSSDKERTRDYEVFVRGDKAGVVTGVQRQ